MEMIDNGILSGSSSSNEGDIEVKEGIFIILQNFIHKN